MTDASTTEVQNWRVAAHVSALVSFIGIPSVLGPLVVWASRKDDPEIEPHARAALNFHLSMFIYMAATGLVTIILVISIIGWLLLPFALVGIVVIAVLELIFTVIASIEAGKGGLYAYPFTIEIVHKS